MKYGKITASFLDNHHPLGDNKDLSQIVSDTAKSLKLAFFVPTPAQNPSYTGFAHAKQPSNYDGVILQNNQYAERLLTMPRVNPITLFLGDLLKNSKEYSTVSTDYPKTYTVKTNSHTYHFTDYAHACQCADELKRTHQTVYFITNHYDTWE